MAINSAKVRRFNLEKEDLSSNLKAKPQNNVSGNQSNSTVNPQVNVNSNQSNAAPPKDCVESLKISCSWGKAKKKKLDEVFVDLDLNCVMLDDKDQLLDYILSPSYGNISFFSNPSNKLQVYKGKLSSDDGAIRHSGDVYGGKAAEETITVDSTNIHSQISKIFFFINVYNNPCGKDKKVYDFSEISSVQIDITENVLSSKNQKRTKYEISKLTNCKNKYSLILGYLHREGNAWKYKRIDNLYDDLSYIITIQRICNSCIA
jgi:tellurium resistance protein TerZ